MWWLPFVKGMGIGASLIIAIGSQNAYLLTQSLNGNYALLIAAVCSLLDALLIFAGVLGLGSLIKSNPQFLIFATWGGAAFLFAYGLMAFKRALSPGHLETGVGKQLSAAAVISTTLAISLLNPHVYLDTVVLVGSVGGQLPGNQPIYFAAGASTASLIWFMSLALAGRILAPYLTDEKHWRRLDILVGITMWVIAVSLIRGS